MKPRTTTLLKIKNEAENVKSFTFAYNNLGSKPGQFVMLWIPGIDQKPFSIANDNGKTFTLVVFKINKFTEALFNLKPGAELGFTGPFGKPYTWQSKQHIIAVGGGYGAAPLAYLLEQAKQDKCTGELLVGARTKKLLLYTKKFPGNTYVSTNDGSAGHKGYITAVLEERLNKLTAVQRKKTIVCICGPEPMEYAAVQVATRHGVPSQVSLERFMKCGVGICGQCCIDNSGEPMCTCGPVISGEKALSLKEFGKYHRDKAGVKIKY
ncbi:MAG: dihydroorotate dehydrogenase electron transfer subunit [Patescibacteria group bacterium]|jgi:dihydroorotate dehydrogenase electron transfer subunit